MNFLKVFTYDQGLSAILTDNGSNMIKAYEEFAIHHFKKDVQPSVEECKQDSDSDENDSGYAEDFNENNGKDVFEDFPIKRLACIAHAINNILNISIMGSKRFKI